VLTLNKQQQILSTAALQASYTDHKTDTINSARDDVTAGACMLWRHTSASHIHWTI